MGFDWLRKRATESGNEETGTSGTSGTFGTSGTSGTSGTAYTAPTLPFINLDPYHKPEQKTETKPWQPKTEEDYRRAAQDLYNRRGEVGVMAGIAAREQWMNSLYKARRDRGEENVPKDIVPYEETLVTASPENTGYWIKVGGKTYTGDEAVRVQKAADDFNKVKSDPKSTQAQLYLAFVNWNKAIGEPVSDIQTQIADRYNEEGDKNILQAMKRVNEGGREAANVKKQSDESFLKISLSELEKQLEQRSKETAAQKEREAKAKTESALNTYYKQSYGKMPGFTEKNVSRKTDASTVNTMPLYNSFRPTEPQARPVDSNIAEQIGKEIYKLKNDASTAPVQIDLNAKVTSGKETLRQMAEALPEEQKKRFAELTGRNALPTEQEIEFKINPKLLQKSEEQKEREKKYNALMDEMAKYGITPDEIKWDEKNQRYVFEDQLFFEGEIPEWFQTVYKQVTGYDIKDDVKIYNQQGEYGVQNPEVLSGTTDPVEDLREDLEKRIELSKSGVKDVLWRTFKRNIGKIQLLPLANIVEGGVDTAAVMAGNLMKWTGKGTNWGGLEKAGSDVIDWAQSNDPKNSWKASIKKDLMGDVPETTTERIMTTVAQIMYMWALSEIGGTAFGGPEMVSPLIKGLKFSSDVAKGIRQGITFTSGFSQGMEEARADGATQDQASLYGLADGLVQVLTEYGLNDLPGIGVGSDDLSSILARKLVNNPKLAGYLAKVFNIAEEGGEDVTSDLVMSFFKQAIYDKDAPNATAEGLVNTFLTSAATAMILNGALGGIESATPEQIVNEVKQQAEAGVITSETDIINEVNRRKKEQNSKLPSEEKFAVDPDEVMPLLQYAAKNNYSPEVIKNVQTVINNEQSQQIISQAAQDISALHLDAEEQTALVEFLKTEETSSISRDLPPESVNKVLQAVENIVDMAEKMNDVVIRTVPQQTVETPNNMMQTGQLADTLDRTANNPVKTDPTTGQAGTKALADIAKVNPGLAENTDLADAYNAGRNGTDLSRATRENAAASNTLDQVEQMYKAGQADAKTGSASAVTSQGANTAGERIEAGISETETSTNFEQADDAKTDVSGSEVNPELEAKLAPFNLSTEERTAAEEYARTGKDSAFSNKFDRDTVKRIMDAAAVIKEYNGKNGVDNQQSKGYDNYRNAVEKYKAAKAANWKNTDGSTWWPDNDGFADTPIKITLQTKTRFDRYGNIFGKFAAPEGTPFGKRSLAPGSENSPCNLYEVVTPFDVYSGETAPWFDQPGGGIQYKLPMSIKDLIKNGYIK